MILLISNHILYPLQLDFDVEDFVSEVHLFSFWIMSRTLADVLVKTTDGHFLVAVTQDY